MLASFLYNNFLNSQISVSFKLYFICFIISLIIAFLEELLLFSIIRNLFHARFLCFINKHRSLNGEAVIKI